MLFIKFVTAICDGCHQFIAFLVLLRSRRIWTISSEARPEDNQECCLFTCFNTGAVHLEILSALEKQICLDAFHRFVSRRGYPKSNLSDKSTEVVGAAGEVCEPFAALEGDKFNWK